MVKRKKSKNKKKLTVSLAVIAAVVLLTVGVFLLLSRSDEQPVSVVSDPDFSDGTPREPGSSVERNGGVTPDDNTDFEAPSDPATSDSGNIVVYGPLSGELFRSGDRLYGTANVDTVWYRLIDDRIGMVAQGSLPVQDGRFSGTFNFNTDGTEGRLDIFNLNEDDRETDSVEIDVRFR
jgi:hypothetical protein